MIKRPISGSRRHVGMPYANQEITSILAAVEAETGDHALSQSICFSPTALTHVKRLIDQGGTIITDASLIENDIDKSLLGTKGAQVRCFLDDPQVDTLAVQRRITRAEVAVDMALTTPGPKLMVVGAAPAAISRLIARRLHEPMTDVCVLAGCSGFASIVQLKERLLDSDLSSIVIRGKKGGIPMTIALVNAILREISKGNPLF